MKHIFWDEQSTDDFFKPFLEELSLHYPISQKKGGVAFKKNGAGLAISSKAGYTVASCANLACAGRAVSALLADIGEPLREKPVFDTMGIMLDCSRNAVPRIDYIKEWLRRMALTGHNLFMLYAEDVFQLPGETFFGYLRGGYSKDDIREIDRYASLLGIEVVACVETLGHMEQMLRWPCYSKYKDIGSILLADDDATYAFIEKIIEFWADALSSRRIHIGMDEAHTLGRGAYQDKHGIVPRTKILANHIARVYDICDKHGLRPMIWSDLLVPAEGKHPPEIAKYVSETVPPEVDLVYWDYYREEQSWYEKRIADHGKTHRVLMSPAVWCWVTPWYNCEYTGKRLVPAFRAAKKGGIHEWIVTMWNDDGAVGDLDSSWNGVVMSAELAYGGHHTEARYRVLFNGVDYNRNREIAVLNDEFSAIGLLWDDPLLGIYWHQLRVNDHDFWTKRRAAYAAALKAASGTDRAKGRAGDIARVKILLEFLAEKVDLRMAIEDAHKNGARPAALKALAARYSKQSGRIDKLADLWRKNWLERYRTNGMEVLQNRLSAQAGRQREAAMRLTEWAEGKAHGIPELDAPDIWCSKYPDFTWRGNSTASVTV